MSKSAGKPNKTGGLPPVFYRLRRAELLFIARIVAVAGLMAVLLIGGGIFWNWDLLWAAVAGAFFLFVGACLVADLRTDYGGRYARVVPYFESDVIGAKTFHSGHTIARNCLFLDQLAREAGLCPFSELGVERSDSTESVTWYDPEDGQKTVADLLAILPERQDVVQDGEELTANLEKIGSRLQEACRLRARFRLELRIDTGYNAMMFDNWKEYGYRY